MFQIRIKARKILLPRILSTKMLEIISRYIFCMYIHAVYDTYIEYLKGLKRFTYYMLYKNLLIC